MFDHSPCLLAQGQPSGLIERHHSEAQAGGIEQLRLIQWAPSKPLKIPVHAKFLHHRAFNGDIGLMQVVGTGPPTTMSALAWC